MPRKLQCSRGAREALTVHLAAATPPYAELPDDCAGDVLEFLGTHLARTELLDVVTHCASSGAQAWVWAVVSAANAVRICAQMLVIGNFC